MPLVLLTATIAAGQSMSNAVDCGTNYAVGITMPPQWTTAHVSVLISVDNVKYYDLFSFDDASGTTPSELKFNVVADAIVKLDPETMLMGRYVKLRSGTRDHPVPQEATRVFGVITNTKITV